MPIKRLTQELYDKIKPHVKKPADDARMMEKFGFCATVIRDIRNTENYQEYCERRFRFHGNPKRSNVKNKAIEPSLETEAELDEMIKKLRRDKTKPDASGSMVFIQNADNVYILGGKDGRD